MYEPFWDFVNTSDIKQLVNFPTHKEGNTLDLILSTIDVVDPVGKLSSSNHQVIWFDILSDVAVIHT